MVCLQVGVPLLGTSRPRRNLRLSSSTLNYGADLSVAESSYIVLGLAHCFEKNEDGKLVDRYVIEPLSANSVECMTTGAKTCFKEVISMQLSDALERDMARLPPSWAEAGAVWCDGYEFRCGACARTWQRPHAQDNLMDIVPLGRTKTGFNYNLDEKRVLNFENIVNDEDNIKQDISIDVYGRKEKEEASAAEANATETSDASAQPAATEDEDLDALLTA